MQVHPISAAKKDMNFLIEPMRGDVVVNSQNDYLPIFGLRSANIVFLANGTASNLQICNVQIKKIGTVRAIKPDDHWSDIRISSCGQVGILN
jgi:hypothetical protein